jgi:thiamine biosynthesis lipoprotein
MIAARPGTGSSSEDDAGPAHLFVARALGSALRLTVVGADPGAAGEAWDAVREEFAAVDEALSRFRDDSELTRLNRLAGRDGRVIASRRLRSCVALMDRARRVTGGRFDARVLAAMEAIGERGADLTSPVDAPSESSSSTLRGALPIPSVPLDTGGIGKGLALRWARDQALSALPYGAGLLIDAGGDLVAAGRPPARGFLVGIEDPVADPGADPLVVVRLPAGAIATSSVRLRHWLAADGAAVHHLVDPGSGRPARSGLLAVSVAAPDPAWAEIWTKALFLGGRARIAREAHARGLAAWWVDAAGHLGLSPAAGPLTAWADRTRVDQG